MKEERNRMSEIPADIIATARKAFSCLAVFDWSDAENKLARAILAERERCAMKAETVFERGAPQAAGLVIAAAIRSGEQQ